MDDTATPPTAEIPMSYLGALERLWEEVGREPIGTLRRETADAWAQVRRIRGRMRYGRRRGGRIS